MRAEPARLALLITLLACPSARVRADPFHAQTLPLGQRALGMGGAFTAVADDPSSAYYNPAGLSMTSDNALSASLTLTAFDRSSIEGGYRTSAGSSSLSHNTGASLPVFVSAVKHLGRRDEEQRRRHAVAFSSFTVGQRRLSFDVEARDRGALSTNLETLSIDSADRTLWHGVSYAYRVPGLLAFGFSGFLSVTRAQYDEERIGATLLELRPDMAFATEVNSWTSHRVTSNVKNLVARFGALYVFDDKLQLGVMFQPPSIHLRGQATVRERSLQNDLSSDTPESSLYLAGQNSLSARNPLPWELRVGGRYRLYHWLTLAVDLSLYGKTGTRSHPVRAIGPRSPDPETGAVATLGAFITDQWHRTFNGNIAVGGEAILKESIAVRAGLYTDLSSAPPIPRYSPNYRPPDVHRAGAALSLGLVSDGYDLSIGIIGVYGRGKALAFNDDPSNESTYARTTATDATFMVFVNGVKNAVRALAKRAEEKLTGEAGAER